MKDLIKEIQELKKTKEILLLSHYYEESDIQDVADAVGDSLFLAQEGQRSKYNNILLAGVYFMAESVKILSPEKTVLIPDVDAGCSLVETSPYEPYLKWRMENPDHIAVTYVNSSALVKSISDVICTSSNAEKVIRSIPENRSILFGPDKNLGQFLIKKTKKPMKLWPGTCEVHVLFSSRKIFLLKQESPEALVLAHPECEESVLDYADVIGSTSLLLNEVKTNPAKSFIIATEPGILHQMQKLRPDAKLIPAPIEGSCGCSECPYMKLNTLEKIKSAMVKMEPQIKVDPAVGVKAKVALQRMMDITNGQNVHWPEYFMK